MRNKLLILLCVFAINAYSQPTTNPVLTKYPLKTAHWTKDLKWNLVTDVTVTNAVVLNTSFSDPKFPNAAASVWVIDSVNLAAIMNGISTGGGGVLYFPAGDYIFDFDVYLPSNVVLRGATPPADKQDALLNTFSPPTHFIFPKYLYNNSGVGTARQTAFKHIHGASSVDNAGLIWLTINRAMINFLPAPAEWSTTILPADEPPYSGTYTQPQPKTVSENIIIMGVRNTNAVEADKDVPNANQNAWQRYPNRRTGNVNVFVYKNGFIANNRINDVEACAYFGDGNPYNGDAHHPTELGAEVASAYANTTYTIQSDDYAIPNYKNGLGVDVGTIKFVYNNHYGMMINRGKLAYYPATKMTNWFGTIWGYTAIEEPASMGTNIEVLDNWVFKTMRPALQVGGNGIEVRRNITRDWKQKEDVVNNVFIGPDGRSTPAGATTFENRAIDISGWNCLVDSNFIEAYRSKVGGYLSTDGEGILHQESSGSTINGMIITNNFSYNYIGLYKSKNIYNANISNNKLYGTNLLVQADHNGGPASCFNVTVSNNIVDNDISLLGSNGGANCFADGNETGGNLIISCYVQESNTAGNIAWRAASGISGVIATGPCIDMVVPSVSISNPATNTYIADIPALPVNLGVQASMTGISDFSFWKIKLFINMMIITDSLNVDGSYTYPWTITEKNEFNITAQITNPADAKIYYTVARIYTVGGQNDNPDNVVLNAADINASVLAYPNPTSGLLDVKVADILVGGTMDIFDINGKKVEQLNAINSNVSFDLSNAGTGIYFIVVSNGKERETTKVIVE